ncbi:hypothetical protein N7535_008519 [Penicillium sp. DV-2018c]|nr:hypothetical protein N7461_002278 [Penicillium sp. DV-2018c]KAJ5563355.1 hypothetical protein N7535_008519 [Penicillium sp. DV-2018c]
MASIPADRPHPSPSPLGPEAAPAAAISATPSRQTLYTSDTSSNLIASDSPSGQYSSFSSSDNDEPPPHSTKAIDEDAACNVVGVSIGREQCRMKAVATPLEEKTRALRRCGQYTATIPDTVGEDGLFASELTAEPQELAESELEESDAGKELHEREEPKPQPQTTSPSVRQTLPHAPRSDLFAGTPGKPGIKDTAVSQRSGFVGSLLKNTLPRRPRAWSGEFKKFLPDLTSLKKRHSLSFRGPNIQNRNRSQTTAPPVKSNLGLPKRTASLGRRQPPEPPSPGSLSNDDDAEAAQPISELRSPDETSAAKHSSARRPSTAMPGRPPSLRRPSSDHSLYLRASSTASSLDQRPLYENQHTQVNSRFKAIKDSLQDSSSRLISMPNLRLDIRPDWSSRPFLPDLGTGPASNGNAPKGIVNGEIPRQATDTPPLPRTNTKPKHPILEAAMADLTGDVVILGGYRGSILRSAKPPHRQLWVPMKVGLNLRKVDLAVGLNPEDEERMEETIFSSGVLCHIGPVDVCRRLIRRLRKSENALSGDLRVHDFGYDWRLSPELLSRRLIAFLENLQCNQEHAPGQPGRGATVIAHSLGGLITRHAVNQRPDLFAGVLYAGVPQHCVNILGPLRSGDDVLISSRVLTAHVNFTFRTSFALLPEDGHCFIDKTSKKEFRIDFFDPKTWEEHCLSPCISPAHPVPQTVLLKDLRLIGKHFSMNLHDDTENPPPTEASDQAQNPLPSATDSTTSTTHHQNTSTTTTKDTTAKNPLDSSPHLNPAAALAEKANPAESLIGPGTNPNSGPTSKAATTTSPIPRSEAMAYLERTLADTKRFKANLAFRPEHHSENRYPPAAVLYGKTVPTVYGARVASPEAIKQVDAYDDLAFAAGDGVCLASAAMLPSGYRIIKDGLVKSERGHVGLLGDLEGVGRCLAALVKGRKEGVGLGVKGL